MAKTINDSSHTHTITDTGKPPISNYLHRQLYCNPGILAPQMREHISHSFTMYVRIFHGCLMLRGIHISHNTELRIFRRLEPCAHYFGRVTFITFSNPCSSLSIHSLLMLFKLKVYRVVASLP